MPCGRSGRNSLTRRYPALFVTLVRWHQVAPVVRYPVMLLPVIVGLPNPERCLRHDSGDKSRNSIPLIRSDPDMRENQKARSTVNFYLNRCDQPTLLVGLLAK